MKKLVLIGAGGHCRSCIDVVNSAKTHEIIAILGKPEELNQPILDLSINGTDDDILSYINKGCEFLITIGQIKNVEPRIRIHKYLLDCNAKMATIISPLAYVSPYAKIAQGTIIMHHAIINAKACIAENCIINTKALIEHDVKIEAHCHISTAAIINGGAVVGNGTFVGSNAVTSQGSSIQPSSFIKAGSLYHVSE